MAPYMKLLKGKMRCIAICSRGYGYSSYNSPMESYSDLAQDIVLMVKEHFRFKRPFYVLGHSYGSITANYLAAWLGELVKGIVLVAPISPTG